MTVFENIDSRMVRLSVIVNTSIVNLPFFVANYKVFYFYRNRYHFLN